MRIVTPSEMRIIEEESERIGVSRRELMNNAGIKLARFISEISREKGFRKIIFLCGKGNNGGDCFVSARELIYSGYDVTIVNVCGLPSTELAKNEFLKIPKERAKIFSGFSSEKLKINSESLEIAFMVGERFKDSAQKFKMREKERMTSIFNAISESDIVVDGVFGTGFHGEIASEIVEYFRLAESKIKIAVDVPSGGNCQTGEIAKGIFNADYTVVFGYIKTGMTQYPLKEKCGDIRLFDIGIPEKSLLAIAKSKEKNVIDSEILKSLKQHRKPDSHKGDFGRLLSVTGCDRMRGASVMSSMSALRSGVGLLTVASSWTCINNISYRIPEAITVPLSADNEGYIMFEENIELLKSEMKKSDAILLGCGMGVTNSTVKLTEFLIKNAECPLIIDADGINCISSDIDILLKKRTDIIITPHPKEMSRLLGADIGSIQKNRIEIVLGFAEKYGITVVLKGAGTIVADSKKCMVNTTGNAGMSRGGSGDVLAGIIASLLAQGYTPFNASIYGTYIHGLAGDITAEKLGHEAMLPTDIINELSASFKSIK